STSRCCKSESKEEEMRRSGHVITVGIASEVERAYRTGWHDAERHHGIAAAVADKRIGADAASEYANQIHRDLTTGGEEERAPVRRAPAGSNPRVGAVGTP